MEETLLTCIIIGGSAGSLEAARQLLLLLEKPLAVPVILVLHRKNNYDSELASVFRYRTGLRVKDADEKEEIKPGTVYIAPADYHLLIEHDHTFSLDGSEKVNYSRPSIDVTMQSAAEVYGRGLAAVLLSGANADGIDGLAEIRKHGGALFVQEPSSATTPFMPQSAIDEGLADYILPPEMIAGVLNTMSKSALSK